VISFYNAPIESKVLKETLLDSPILPMQPKCYHIEMRS